MGWLIIITCIVIIGVYFIGMIITYTEDKYPEFEQLMEDRERCRELVFWPKILFKKTKYEIINRLIDFYQTFYTLFFVIMFIVCMPIGIIVSAFSKKPYTETKFFKKLDKASNKY